MRKNIISIAAALGIATSGLTAVSANADGYYWWGTVISDEQINEIAQGMVELEASNVFNTGSEEVVAAYMSENYNNILAFTEYPAQISIDFFDSTGLETLQSIVNDYNSENDTNITASVSEEYLTGMVTLKGVQNYDTVAKILKDAIISENIAESLTYTSASINWRAGYYGDDSVLTYTELYGNGNDLNAIESYFIDNNIDYRYNNSALIGGEDLTRVEQMEIAYDLYDNYGAVFSHIYLMDCDDSCSAGGVYIDMLNAVDGYANSDGELNISDAVAIMASVTNSRKYPLSIEGAYNADVTGYDGISSDDALAVQRMLI
ncbi:MAG: hypothetical protein LUD57_07345 [Ruminococcus sp.]|nr:hypothetical protein [Ruminococcus sp.]